MQHKKGFLIAVTAGLLIGTGIGYAQAGERDVPIKGTFAGSFLTTRMNLDPSDGFLAGWSTALSNRTGMRNMLQSVVERRVANPPTGRCGDWLELELVTGRGIGTNMVTYDQLFISS